MRKILSRHQHAGERVKPSKRRSVTVIGVAILAILAIVVVTVDYVRNASAAPACNYIAPTKVIVNSPSNFGSRIDNWDYNGYHYEIWGVGIATGSASQNQIISSRQCGGGPGNELIRTDSGSLLHNGQKPVDVMLGVPNHFIYNYSGKWENVGTAATPTPASRPPIFMNNFGSSAVKLDDAGLATIKGRYGNDTRIYCQNMPSVRMTTGVASGCGDINYPANGTGYLITHPGCHIDDPANGVTPRYNYDLDNTGPYSCGDSNDFRWYMNSQDAAHNLYAGGQDDVSLANLIGCNGNHNCNKTSDPLNNFFLRFAMKNTQYQPSSNLVVLTFKYPIPVSTWQYTPSISAAAGNPATYVTSGQSLSFDSWATNNNIGTGAAYHLDLMRTITNVAGVVGPAASMKTYPNAGNFAGLAANAATTPHQTGATNILPTAIPGEKYCYFTRVTPASPSIGSADSSSICYTVDSTTHPFLDTAKGDVHAAGYNINCAANGLGNVLGQYSSTTHLGSKADYVVSAGGTITNFGSNGSPTGTALGYAHYGQVCMPQVVASADAYVAAHGSIDPGANFTPGAPAAGTMFKHVGNLTLNGGTVGSRYTLYVVGDVHITGSINYAGATVSRANLPSFGVIATGSIYIDPAVHAPGLVGFYYAQSRINTCATGPAFDIHAAGSAQVCRNQLNVSGLLMADDIRFWRTSGDVATVGSPASELVTADGRLYLATPPAFSDLISPAVTDPNYSGDLPPLF